MEHIPLSLLLLILTSLLLISAFFSASETSMMAINPYRLRHLVKKKNKAARRTTRLLQHTDRLLSMILIGNNFVNILASSLATIIALRLWGDSGIAISTLTLTILILIFGEVTPKTIAVLYPERIAFSVSIILSLLMKLLKPFVIALNWFCRQLMRLFGIHPQKKTNNQLNTDELRSLLTESSPFLPKKRRNMLLSVLDLETISVNDILTPRNDIIGINIEDNIETIISKLKTSQYTRLPIYKNDINNLIGLLHMRRISRLLDLKELSKKLILKEVEPAYFVPETTPLHTQLVNFQQSKKRMGMVVDEYGDITGLVTLDDILEEIVGDFTTDLADIGHEIIQKTDGSYIIDGTSSIREINKDLNWHLPVDEARTLNGLITEILESIPDSPVCLQYEQYRFEVLDIQENRITSVKVTKESNTSHI